MSAANTLSPSNASEVAGEKSESASVAQRSPPSPASRARTKRSAEPTKTDPPPAVGADPAVELACNATAGHPVPRRASNAATTTCGVSVASHRVHLAVRDRERCVDVAVEVLRPRHGTVLQRDRSDRAFLIPDEGVRAVDRDPAPGQRLQRGSPELGPVTQGDSNERRGVALLVRGCGGRARGGGRGRITAGWARRRARRAGGVDRAGALEVHEDATTPAPRDRRNREGPARPGDLPLDRAGRDVDPVDGLLAHGDARSPATTAPESASPAGAGRVHATRYGGAGPSARTRVTRASLEL